MAGVVRRPAHGDGRRIPDIAVLGHVAPRAVAVQVLVADYVFGHIAARGRIVPARIAVVAEIVERIGARQVVDLVVAQLRVMERDRLALVDGKARAALAVNVAAAAEHGDDGRTAVGFDVDAEHADAIDHECKRRRVDLVALAVVQAAHAQVQRALRQFHLRGVVGEIEEVETRVLIHAHGGGADFQRRARAAVGPQLVACDQRAIQLRLHPVVFAGRYEADIALHVGKPGHAAWRVDRRTVVLRQHGEGKADTGQ